MSNVARDINLTGDVYIDGTLTASNLTTDSSSSDVMIKRVLMSNQQFPWDAASTLKRVGSSKHAALTHIGVVGPNGKNLVAEPPEGVTVTAIMPMGETYDNGSHGIQNLLEYSDAKMGAAGKNTASKAGTTFRAGIEFSSPVAVSRVFASTRNRYSEQASNVWIICEDDSGETIKLFDMGLHSKNSPAVKIFEM